MAPTRIDCLAYTIWSSLGPECARARRISRTCLITDFRRILRCECVDENERRWSFQSNSIRKSAGNLHMAPDSGRKRFYFRRLVLLKLKWNRCDERIVEDENPVFLPQDACFPRQIHFGLILIRYHRLFILLWLFCTLFRFAVV